MKQFLFVLTCLAIVNGYCQRYSSSDYCLVWSDEFEVDGLPNTANWRYETGYSIRNNEAQNYTANRLENARVENSHLIIEARKDNYEGHEVSSASLVSWGKVVHQYGRFECRAKIDVRSGSWPAFWTLGEAGEWPSNGEIDIMEFYQGKLLGNAAWGTETRWSGNWDSQSLSVSGLGHNWEDEFHVFMMEWDASYIRLYVDHILINEVNLNNTFNGSLGDYKNPFRQPHYLILNQAIGGNNGGNYSNTQFPIKYEIDYVRIYQRGNCNLDCNWIEGGGAYNDDCLQCVGGDTDKEACTLSCDGNLLANPNFEEGDVINWTGWGDRAVSNDAYDGNGAVSVGDGAVEQEVSVTPNTPYVLKAFTRKAGGGAVYLGVKNHGNGETSLRIDNNTWQEKEHRFTTGNSTTALIYYWNPDGGTAYADNFKLFPQGCSVTSVEGLSLDDDLQVFPNPSERCFSIKSSSFIEIEVFDINGILVEKVKSNNASTDFGVLLRSGVYSVKVLKEGVCSWQRVVKL